MSSSSAPGVSVVVTAIGGEVAGALANLTSHPPSNQGGGGCQPFIKEAGINLLVLVLLWLRPVEANHGYGGCAAAGVVSAAFWVPSGLLTIGSVPLIGMAMQVAVNCAANAVLSFLVFWLVLGSAMKEYDCGHDCTYYRAPIYLAATVLGMFGLIFAEKIATALKLENKKENAAKLAQYDSLPERQNLLINDEQPASVSAKTPSSFAFVLGLILSIFCGIFAAAQYAVITIAKKEFSKEHNCTIQSVVGHKKALKRGQNACTPFENEMFDNFGSWIVSFGIGAVVVTLLLLGLTILYRKFTGNCKPISLHWNVLRFAGVAAGSSWAIANFLQLAAVVLGGQAVLMAQTLSAQIITSGLFGMLWYNECGGTGSKVVWGVSAVWTLVAMVLLGLEKSA